MQKLDIAVSTAREVGIHGNMNLKQAKLVLDQNGIKLHEITKGPWNTTISLVLKELVKEEGNVEVLAPVVGQIVEDNILTTSVTVHTPEDFVIAMEAMQEALDNHMWLVPEQITVTREIGWTNGFQVITDEDEAKAHEEQVEMGRLRFRNLNASFHGKDSFVTTCMASSVQAKMDAHEEEIQAKINKKLADEAAQERKQQNQGRGVARQHQMAKERKRMEYKAKQAGMSVAEYKANEERRDKEAKERDKRDMANEEIKAETEILKSTQLQKACERAAQANWDRDMKVMKEWGTFLDSLSDEDNEAARKEARRLSLPYNDGGLVCMGLNQAMKTVMKRFKKAAQAYMALSEDYEDTLEIALEQAEDKVHAWSEANEDTHSNYEDFMRAFIAEVLTWNLSC